MAKLLSREKNPVTGLTEEYWHDPSAGTITIKHYQDIDPMLQANRNEFNSYSTKGRNNFNEGIGRKVASIPPGAVHRLKAMGHDVMTMKEPALRKLLNDPEFSAFRTAPGRL